MAATKTAKTKNPDRKGAEGRAWKKSHGVVKVKPAPSPEKVARRAQKVSIGGGSRYTMVNLTWEGATQMMSQKWPNTRKVRSLDNYLAEGKSVKKDSADPFERNSERNGR